MKIGILQTGHAPDALAADFGDYPDMFARLLAGHGFDFQTWPVVDGVFPDSVHDADGWLITGSRHGAYEDLPWIPRLEEFLRRAYGAGVPILGICFGHQILAQALGGKVEKFPGGWAVGATEYDGEIGHLVLNAWHQDQVSELPPDAHVIGTSPHCAIAALAYGDTAAPRALSYQPHPEFSPEFVAGLIRTRGKGVVPDDLLQQALARGDRPLDAGRVADQIAAFFKQAHSQTGPRGGND